MNAKSKTNLTLSQYCNFNIPIEPADFSPQKLSKPHATTLEKNSILTGNKNTKKPETTRLQSDGMLIVRMLVLCIYITHKMLLFMLTQMSDS